MKDFLAQQALYWIHRLLSLTWRKHYHIDPEFIERHNNGEPSTVAAFHGDQLATLHLLRKYRFTVMVSDSRDGELLASLIEKNKGETARGSSSKGGVKALKSMIKVARSGRPIVIAVDGPKGPIHEVKPGIFEIARLAKAPIFSLSAGVSNYGRAYTAWDRTLIPKPFARVDVVIKKAMDPLGRDVDSKSPELAQELADKILDCRRDAIGYVKGN